jgi:hypothetical protein
MLLNRTRVQRTPPKRHEEPLVKFDPQGQPVYREDRALPVRPKPDTMQTRMVNSGIIAATR